MDLPAPLKICLGKHPADRDQSAVDQDASFAGHAFNDSFCQNLPLARCETVKQQCDPTTIIRRGQT
jgi:hypothetical protein